LVLIDNDVKIHGGCAVDASGSVHCFVTDMIFSRRVCVGNMNKVLTMYERQLRNISLRRKQQSGWEFSNHMNYYCEIDGEVFGERITS
jgi:hypothetical protein